MFEYKKISKNTKSTKSTSDLNCSFDGLSIQIGWLVEELDQKNNWIMS
ncbi:unnamed protein product [Paramecium octaurelia]|uniref:Uncharacterized protein n=1 Tax=Paramecium octaurelia TaxID=43137 RepID=A0A8S1UYH9_PAROT|nr:unnamed protein product [Paramecium octaurelia]